jgi:hypothetical protein
MSIIRRGESLARVVALGSALLSASCGKSASSTADTEGGNGGSTAGEIADAAAPTGCPKSALTILFSPMYSAYDGVHTFQIPAVVNGLDPTAITIDWSASDPTMVKLEPDPTTGGVMITTQKSGTVSIIANAGSLCGASLLTITAATPQDWTDGSNRYNDGVVVNRLPRPGGGGMAGGDGGTAEAACTNCHGDTASGPFKTVQHTPEQTGGFSDTDLTNIFEKGVVPTGGYFDTSIVSYAEWQGFHKWDVGDSPQGVVVYLRSLTPAAQTGEANFGGRFDGGVGRGGNGNGGGGRNGGGRPGGGAGGAERGAGGTGGAAESGGGGAVNGGAGGSSAGSGGA